MTRAIEFYEKTKDYKKLSLLWNSKGLALESLGAHLKNQGNQYTDEEGRKNNIHSEDTMNSDVRALECFDNAINFSNTKDVDSKDGNIAETDIANMHHNRGYTYAKLGKYEKAIENFEQAIKHFEKAGKNADPTEFADAYRNQGYAIARNKYCAENLDKASYSCAISKLEESTKKCPTFALAQNTEGYVHTMFENYEKARECFAKARNLDPDFARAWRNYGYVLYCIERDKQLKEYLDHDETYESAKEKGILDIVVNYLSTAIELDPHDPYAWHYRAHVYFRKKEYDNAIRDFDKAIQIKFSFYDAWYGKGMVFDTKKQYEEAIKCFDQAIKLCNGRRDKEKENQKIRECEKIVEYKKLAYVFISKGMSHVNFADSIPKYKKNNKNKPLKDAEESFNEAKKIFDTIEIESGLTIEKDVGMGLALYNRGYTIADSVIDEDSDIGEDSVIDKTMEVEYKKEQYGKAIKDFKDATESFQRSQKNPKQELLMNRYIANTLRNEGFIHAKLARISSEKEAKHKEHEKAVDCFEKSTKVEDRETSALAWNSRGYHIIGFLKDLECAGFNTKQEIENAKIYFDNAIKNVIKNVESDTRYEAYFYYNKGYALYTSGSDKYRCEEYNEAKIDFVKAAGCFEEALTYDREYADAWFIRALSIYYSETSETLNNTDSKTAAVYTREKYAIIEYLDNFIELYDKAELNKKTENDEKFPYAWYQKGIVLASLGRYEEAIRCFDESTSLNYDFGEAWHRKGVSFYSTQNYNLALKCFDQAERCYKKKRYDSNSNYYIELRLIRGQSNYNAGNLEDANMDLKKISNDIPHENEEEYKKTLSRKYLILGLILYEEEDLKKAKKMFDKAIEMFDKPNDPNLAEIHYNLAKLHSTMNENNEAKKSLDRCIKSCNGKDANGKQELKEKAIEARNKYKESRQTDWYQWWLGRGRGKKIAGIILIFALISFIISPIIIIGDAMVHLINSNSTNFTTFITKSVTAQTIAVFTLAIGALLAILLLPSLQRFRVATIELETIPVNIKDQEVMVPPPPKINPPDSNEMPFKITAQYFRMPLRYQMQMQVYAPIEPTRAPTKYKKILFA